MSNVLPAILLASAAVMLVSLAGLIFVSGRLAQWLRRNLGYLVSFSAGVFLVVSLNLAAEAVELSDRPLFSVLFVILGLFLFYIPSRFMSEAHHHHLESVDDHRHDRGSAYRILSSDALHNIADGILLVPAFLIDLRLGAIAAVGVLVHEFVQEISEFFVLKLSGYSSRQALWRNFAVSATILIGVAVGWFLVSFEKLIGPILGLASGTLLYVVLADLIPESIRFSRLHKERFKYLAWALAGALLIILLNQIVPEI